MIKLFITGLLMTGLYGLAIGQREIQAAEKTPVFLPDKAYSLGINSQLAIDGFLDPGTLAPIEFLLRRGLPGDRSLRLRTSGWVENTNKIEGEENLKIQQSRFAIALGHEWHHPINKKLGYYFGADLEKGWDIHNTTTKSYNYTESFGYFTTRRYDFITTKSLGLLPFAGFTYSPLPDLFVSYEMRFAITHKNVVYTQDSFHKQISDPNRLGEAHTIGGYKLNGWSFDFQPYSGIFINLKF